MDSGLVPVPMNASTPSLGATSRRGSVVLLTLAASLMFPAAATAGTSLLVNDTFDTNNASSYAHWQAATVSSRASVTSTGNALVIASPSAADGKGDNLTGRAFAETTLGVGDMLTFSYDFTSNSAGTTTSNLQRVGLYDLGATLTDGTLGASTTSKAGYYSFFANNNTAGGNAAVLRREIIADGTSTSNTVEGVAASTTIANTAAKATIDANITRSVVFSITNQGNGATSVTSTLYSAAGGGGTALYALSATDNSGLITFDSFFLLTPTNTTVTYDNIQVALTTAIPEPGTTATCIGGFGLITALILRRKRLAAR